MSCVRNSSVSTLPTPNYRPWRVFSNNKAMDGQAPPPRCAFIFDALRKNYSQQSTTAKLFHRSTNPYSTNKCTVLLICISLLINSYMFLLNCHHQGTNTYITKTYNNKMVLKFLRISECTYYSYNLKYLKYYKTLILNCHEIMVAFAVDNCRLAS
jgi:hypothetical protein